MNQTDQNIQKLLLEQMENHKIASELEQNIMNRINTQKDYSKVLRKSKRNIKRGVFASVILLITFITTTYFELSTSINLDQHDFRTFFPAIFSGIMILIIYLEMLIGVSLLKKE